MPLAKDKGLTGGDHHRQRGDGAPIAESLHERPGIVFIADGPAEAESCDSEAGERALEMPIHPPTQAFDSVRIERLARRNQALTLDLSPDGKLVRCHGHLVQQSPAFMPITQLFTICLSHKEGHGPPGARAAAGPVPVPRRGP